MKHLLIPFSCLFSFTGYVATKSHWVHFKLFWSSYDWKSAMWPSLVFTTFICTLWVDSMCFSKYSVLFNVLSQRLHWISHLFLSTCLFKSSALLKTTGQFSHLNSSLKHFVMLSLWLFLLLYGILFSQWLHVTSLCDCMCVFSFMPQCISSHTSHKWEHDHHVLLEYAFSDVFQKELQFVKWHKKAWWLQIFLPIKFWISDMTIFSLPKTKKYWESESNQCKRCWPIRQVDGWMRTSVRGTGRSSFYCPNPPRKMRH